MKVGARTGLPELLGPGCLVSYKILTLFLKSTLIVKANHIKKKIGKNFFREARPTFTVTFSFPKNDIFLIWSPAPTTIAISYLLMMQRFVQ